MAIIQKASEDENGQKIRLRIEQLANQVIPLLGGHTEYEIDSVFALCKEKIKHEVPISSIPQPA